MPINMVSLVKDIFICLLLYLMIIPVKKFYVVIKVSNTNVSLMPVTCITLKINILEFLS